MDDKTRLEVIKAEMKLIIRILEDLVTFDDTTKVHIKYMSEYDELKKERKELEQKLSIKAIAA